MGIMFREKRKRKYSVRHIAYGLWLVAFSGIVIKLMTNNDPLAAILMSLFLFGMMDPMVGLMTGVNHTLKFYEWVFNWLNRWLNKYW